MPAVPSHLLHLVPLRIALAAAAAAVAAGCDGVFMEVHDNVKNAKSDSATQWPLDRFESLTKKLIEIRRVIE